MTQQNWVKIEVALAVHQLLLAEHGGGNGVRDQKLLESALSRPKQKYVYETESSLFDLAAALSFGLDKNRPFVDGNKRIALTLALVFLEINGIEIVAPEANAALACEALAAGKVSEQELSEWYGSYSREEV